MTCDAWPVVWTCDKPAGLTDEQEQAALDAAQLLLWSRTGRRLGVCEATEQFQPFGPCSMPAYRPGGPAFGVNSAGGDVFLTNTPVQSVVGVAVDGVQLPGSRYAVQGSRLVPVGAGWPSGSPVVVTYRWGIPIEGWLAGLVAMAVGEVAGELASGMCGGACKLPSRMVSITRQGVTVELGTADDYVKAGLLGLPLADQLITTMNPAKRQGAARVYSPDMAPAVTANGPLLPIVPADLIIDGGEP